jgi:hypothetical protein
VSDYRIKQAAEASARATAQRQYRERTFSCEPIKQQTTILKLRAKGWIVYKRENMRAIQGSPSPMIVHVTFLRYKPTGVKWKDLPTEAQELMLRMAQDSLLSHWTEGKF